jgi:hypothetical protein
MFMENPNYIESQEKPKAVSVEKTDSGSLSITISEDLKDKMDIGYLAGIAHDIQSNIAETGLFEVILDEENFNIVVRSFIDGQEVPDSIKTQIEDIF